MSFSGQRIKYSELPDEIFIVKIGSGYKIYSKLSTAKGVVTSERKYGYHKDIQLLKFDLINGVIVNV